MISKSREEKIYFDQAYNQYNESRQSSTLEGIYQWVNFSTIFFDMTY